jgi:hypothetical protein
MITQKQLSLYLVNSFNLKFNIKIIDSSLTEKELNNLSNTNDLIIEETWISGGIFGNNCFDYLNCKVEPEFEKDLLNNLFLFLKNLNINLDYEVLKENIKTETFNDEQDYYSNYYEYTCSYIKLLDLYKILNKKKT